MSGFEVGGGGVVGMVRHGVMVITPVGVGALLYVGAWMLEGALGWEAGVRRVGLGWFLVVLGLGVIGWASLQFRRHGTTIFPTGQPSGLIESGPFLWSRNPIYVADCFVAVGVSCLMGGGAYWLVPPMLFLVLRWVYVPEEEGKMRRRFGVEYDAYCRRVRRWL